MQQCTNRLPEQSVHKLQTPGSQHRQSSVSWTVDFGNCRSSVLEVVLQIGFNVSDKMPSPLPSPFLPPIPKFCQPSAASAQPTKPVVLLRMPGAAGAAEAGVVRVGAKSGVNYQLAVGKLRLVHAFWRHVSTCNGRVNTFVLLNLKGHSVWLSGLSRWLILVLATILQTLCSRSRPIIV